MSDISLAIIAAKDHARAEFPKESCGLIVRGQYVPCVNRATDPAHHIENDKNCPCQLCAFVIDKKDFARHFASGIELVLHSHPWGPLFPSEADMSSQIATDLPWGIIALDDERIGDPIIWGGRTPTAPLVGRQFMHGVTDCYDIIRDTYRLGKDELAKQDIIWPFDPISLPKYARADGWWETDRDFYEDEPGKIGFVEIAITDASPGDVFLLKIKSAKFNHGGVLLGGGLILHHLPQRLSRREPAGLWARSAGRWLRYSGQGAQL